MEIMKNYPIIRNALYFNSSSLSLKNVIKAKKMDLEAILANFVFTCFLILAVKLELLQHMKTVESFRKWPSLIALNGKIIH